MRAGAAGAEALAGNRIWATAGDLNLPAPATGVATLSRSSPRTHLPARAAHGEGGSGHRLRAVAGACRGFWETARALHS